MNRLCALILSVLTVALIGACNDDTQAPFDPAVEQQLDALLRDSTAAQNLPSVAVWVSVPGRGEYRRAFGEANLQTHAPRRLDEPIRIASITKTFIGTAVLMLVDDGRLALTDTLSKWYPAFPNAHLITIDHLLRMRSGIADSLDAGFLVEFYADPLLPLTAEDMIARSAGRAAEFIAPDTLTRYDNINFVLLEQIAVKVSSLSIAALLDARVFKPLGMTGTSYPSGTELGGTNRGYLWNPGSGRFEDLTVLNPVPAGGAGAMISTLADLHRYSRALCSASLLQPATQALRLQGTTIDGEPEFVKYARGLELLGRFCGHNGTIFGFSTEMFYLPEKDAVVIVSVNRLDLDDRSQSTEIFLKITKFLFPGDVSW